MAAASLDGLVGARRKVALKNFTAWDRSQAFMETACANYFARCGTPSISRETRG
jgi:hypothetical protein